MIRFAKSSSLLFCVFAVSASLSWGAEDSSAESEFFEEKIRPALVEHCYECHSAAAEKLQGGLRLDTSDALRGGGDSGPAIVPGNTQESLLIQAIRYEGLEMPPAGKLPDETIADFARWVKSGAADPRNEVVTQATPEQEIDWKQARQFWAFRPPQQAPLPPVANSAWPRRRHDYFVLRQLEAAGLPPSEPAPSQMLVRRLAFDLTGIPPAAEVVQQFNQQLNGPAYEQLVDRLLASPRFGERWGRMWLDLARFAEDQAHIVGDNESLFYPNAHLYRDWIIHALNRDLPFDRFIQLQLAADLIEPDDDTNQAALGFIGLGPKYYDRKRLQVQADEWEDRVDTVSRGLLGITVACARCHDHKYDPIQTEDYYAMAGIFASTEMYNRPREVAADVDQQEANKTNSPQEAMHVVREGKPTDLHVFIRGDAENQGAVVSRGYVRVLSSSQRHEFTEGSGRAELANAIANNDNPLTSRVFVNRIWGHLLGQALVGTPSNFGAVGERPTHPELLDDLAVRFMQNGWSLKWLMREIVTSATYRQSSIASAIHVSRDPDNKLLGRMNRRRLEIEAWRDSILSASRMLGSQIGGPSMDPKDPDVARRTIYARISRFKLDPMLALFDFPDANVHAAVRSQTTTPIQKLFVMNHPFMLRQSKRIAVQVLADASSSSERVQGLYLRLLSRSPSPEELELALAFLEGEDPHAVQAWVQFTQALIASNEMLFLD